MQAKEQNISPIKQRILYFAGTLGISKRDFYTKIGVSRGTLESKTGITEDVLTKFFATYPQVNVEWVMLGLGEMLKTKRTLNIKTDNTSDNLEDKVTELLTEKQPLKPMIDSIMNYLQEKDKEIGRLNKEIGKLETRIEELEREVPVQTIAPRYAHSPTREPVET